MSKNKKILIVIGSFKTGGAERMSINVGEELRRNGFEVHFALQRPIIEIPNNINPIFIHYLNSNTDKHKFLIHLNSVVQIFLLQLKIRPICVIGFTYFSSLLACLSFSRNVIGRFDWNPYTVKRKLRHRMATFVSRWPFVKKVVVPSNGIGDRLRMVNRQFKKKIYVIYNSIDFENVSAMSLNEINLNLEYRPKYISAMGRFVQKKNYALLLKVYAKSVIKEKYDLVLIGDGLLKKELKELSIELGVSENVFFTGFLKNPFPIIRKSQFFVNTSESESFCNVILESLSLRVPVIATDCEFGPSEMIQSEINGLLVPVNDQEFLIDTFNRVFNDENILEGFKEHTISSVEKFKLDTIGQSWVELIDEMT